MKTKVLYDRDLADKKIDMRSVDVFRVKGNKMIIQYKIDFYDER